MIQKQKALEARIETTKDDIITQDHLIGIAFLIQKQTWMLRAHTK